MPSQSGNSKRSKGVSSNPPVEVFWQRYLDEYAREHLRPRTVEIITLHWGQFIAFVKPARLGDVTQQDVERFKSHQKAAGRAEQSVNNALKDINTRSYPPLHTSNNGA